MNTFRVVATSSRTLLATQTSIVRMGLFALRIIAVDYGVNSVKGMVVRHGAALGGDALIEAQCTAMGIPTDPYPVKKADRDRVGRAAGPLRNIAMLDAGCDWLLAIRLGGASSKGTTQCMEEARMRGIPVLLFDL